MDGSAEEITLPGGWRLWEQFSLRGPGFPAGGVLDLAPEGLGVLADKFGAGEALAGEVWEEFEGVFGAAAGGDGVAVAGHCAVVGFPAGGGVAEPAGSGFGREAVLVVDAVGGRADEYAAAARGVGGALLAALLREERHDRVLRPGRMGPVGPVRGRGGGRPGSGLVEASEVYFSSWSVDVLARVIGADPGVREWVAPRRVPFVGVSGGAASGACRAVWCRCRAVRRSR